MLVALLLLAFFVGGLLRVTRDGTGVRRVRPRGVSSSRCQTTGSASVADGRYIEVELARRQPRRPRATWAGGKQ